MASKAVEARRVTREEISVEEAQSAVSAAEAAEGVYA